MVDKLSPSATPHPKKIKDGKLARVGLCAINASFRGEGEITFSFIRSQTNRWKITDSRTSKEKNNRKKKEKRIGK